MRQIQLPDSDLSVSAICYGTADWGAKSGSIDLERLYVAYREAGGNCFDTAHCYSFWVDQLGTPERLLGQFVRRHDDRKNVIVCTKGCHITGGPKYPRPERYMTPEWLGRDLRESLERLRMEYVDLYYLHRDDPQVPVDEIVDALDEHASAGRVRHVACSNWRPPRIEQANAYAKGKVLKPFVASQIMWNLAELAKPMPADLCVMDDEQRRWYERSKLPVFSFSPTANGYFAKGGTQSNSYDTPASVARLERTRQLATKLNATPNAVALAYLMGHDFPAVPILGTTNLDHLRDGLSAAEIRLTPEQVRWLREG